MRLNKLIALFLTALSASAITARAEIFYRLNMGGTLPGTATAPNGTFSWHNDGTYGTVLKVVCSDTSDPNVNNERAEFVASGSNNKYFDKTVYMGWRSYLSLPTPSSSSWNNIMQGKAAGNFTLNHPFYLRADSGTLRLGTDAAGYIWSRTLPHQTWFSIVIKIRYSTSPSTGYAEVWYNGTKQTLANGTQQFKFQTWSGSDNNIHWGIYRSKSINGTATHYMWRPTIASTYAEAAPEGSGTGVTFYSSVNYAGTASQVLAKGTYTMSQLAALGVANDSASSVKIPSGWTVTIYQNDNFGGTSWVRTADTPSFTSITGLNDAMSSCRIE